MNINIKNPIINIILCKIQHYNPRVYWKMRDIVINPNNNMPKIIKYIYIYRIKKMDAYNNASMGTDIESGAIFLTHPGLPHGLNGIIISPYTKIGKNCIIYQQVTIANKGPFAAEIGDNCMIGAGAKIIGHVIIGDNVKIGANCVVTKDIPNNSTVVGVPARILD